MSEVVVINVHGGFPSAMVDRSLEELPGFARLARLSDVHDRVYPTNACAGPSLHDTFMDAPMGAMADSVWHPWAFCRHASRTLFHVFKQANYTTRLFGAFGLDARLDPHTCMNNVHHLALLAKYGLDECDAQDAAFTCQPAFGHDEWVMRRVAEHLKRPSDSNRLTVVNLLGCRDVQKCVFHDIDPEKAVIPVMRLTTDGGADDDQRTFATNVLDDDARTKGSPAHGIDALRRSAQLNDWIRGCRGQRCERQELTRVVCELHRFCWECLRGIDKGLCDVLDALEKSGRFDDAIVYVYTDHPISLYEHGEVGEAPWEACLRGFMMCKTRSGAHGSRSSAPLSLVRLPTMLMSDAGILADWHNAPKSTACCVTLGTACSWLVRARMEPQIDVTRLRTFFIRTMVFYNCRKYALTFWFSLADISADTATQQHWPNPVIGVTMHAFADRDALQIYEHTTDPYEMHNLAHAKMWLCGDVATRLKQMVDDELIALNLRNVHLKIPEQVQTLSIDNITFSSVQLHHRIRCLRAPTIEKMRDATTQTTPVATEQSTMSVVVEEREVVRSPASRQNSLPAETELQELLPDKSPRMQYFRGKSIADSVPPPQRNRNATTRAKTRNTAQYLRQR